MEFSKNVASILCFFFLLYPTKGLADSSHLEENENEEPVNVTVELAIVCDNEFSKIFGYDKNKITDYWINQVQDLEIQFQILRLTQVSFALNSVTIIENASNQPFVEHARSKNGSTDLNKMEKNFEKWVYQTQNLVKFDIVMLITGSSGYGRSVGDEGSACNLNNYHKEYLSVIILRSGIRNWHTHWDLGIAMATLLRAYIRDVCSETRDALNELAISSGNYFLECSDDCLHQYVTSESASCLRNVNVRTNSTLQEKHLTPLSMQEECRLILNDTSVVADTAGASCKVGRCMARNTTFTGHFIFPIYNTPCGNNKACFRGRCLQKGFIVKSSQTEKCIKSDSKFVPDDIVKLTKCPTYPTKLDELMFLDMGKVGFYLSVSYINPGFFSLEKCLTAASDETHLAFKSCPDESSVEFGWDIVNVGDNSSECLLCHRESRKCATVDANMGIVLSSRVSTNDPANIWLINGDKSNAAKLTKNKKTWEYYNREITVEIAIVCDMEFGSLFTNNRDKIREYWNYMLRDVDAKFRTLKNINVSFRVTSLLLLQSKQDQMFLSETRHGEETNIRQMNEQFGQWMYKQLDSFPKFDIAILATGSFGLDSRSESTLYGACKADKVAQKYLGTLVIRVGPFNTDWCDDLTQAIANLLGSGPSSSYNQCSKFRYAFSKHDDHVISEHVNLGHASCLHQIDSPKESEVHLEDLVTVPSVSEQCQLLQNDSATFTKQGEDNCQEAKCYKKGEYPIFVKNIYPINYTPCGNNSYCFRGSCIPRGNQLKHLLSGKCINGVDRFQINDTVQLTPCSKLATPLDQFVLLNGGNNATLLATPYFSEDNTLTYKCLHVDSKKFAFRYERCLTYDSFLSWNLRKISNESKEFRVFHHGTGKCLRVEKDFRLYLDYDCTKEDSKFEWEIVKIKTRKGNIESDINGWRVVFYIMVAITGVFGIVAFVVIGKFAWRQWSAWRQNKLILDTFCSEYSFRPGSHSEVQAYLLPFDNGRWNVPEKDLKLGKKVGAGAFGCVFEGIVYGVEVNGEIRDETTVAVKMLKFGADSRHFRALVSELKILSHIGSHINVVNLLGACTENIRKKKLYIILEFCKYGSLRQHLEKNRSRFVNQKDIPAGKIQNITGHNTPGDLLNHSTSEKEACEEAENSIPPKRQRKLTSGNQRQSQPGTGTPEDQERSITSMDLICWAFQIATGMEYLANRNILHGDLALRNILLAENDTVKICDFGFSRELERCYHYRYKINLNKSRLPVKWMAVEALKTGLLSTESDCWAYGVVLWEIFSLGGCPYQDQKIDDTFVDQIADGYRLQKPEFAPQQVYEIMEECWFDDPESRPKFSDLKRDFGNMMGNKLMGRFVQLNSDYQRLNKAKLTDTYDRLVNRGRSSIRRDQTRRRRREEDSEQYLLPRERQQHAEEPVHAESTYSDNTKLRAEMTTTEDNSKCALLDDYKKCQFKKSETQVDTIDETL